MKEESDEAGEYLGNRYMQVHGARTEYPSRSQESGVGVLRRAGIDTGESLETRES